jgi:hypothetical protein
MSKADWWQSDGRSAREYAEALLIMKGDAPRQRNFMSTHVPEHLRELTRTHYKNALALGKGDEER